MTRKSRMSQLGGAGLAVALSMVSVCHAYTIPRSSNTPKLTYRAAESASTYIQMTYDDAPDPTTFREAEVLGLRLMQEGSFEEALVGMYFLWVLWSSIWKHVLWEGFSWSPAPPTLMDFSHARFCLNTQRTHSLFFG